MILFLISAVLPANAFQIAEACEEYIYAELPMNQASDVLPPDASLPIILHTECGAFGEIDVRLHRMVDGIAAEEITSETVTLEPDSQTLVMLTPPDPLLESTYYGALTVFNGYETVYEFSTGDTNAIGMEGGTPSLEITEMTAFETDTGSYEILVDTVLSPLDDPDGLSVLQIHDAKTDAIILSRFAQPDSGDQRIMVFSSSAEEQCFYLTQTDGLGTQSDASPEVCATPEIIAYSRGLCSTTHAAPALFSSLFAMLFGLRRRIK